MRFIDEAIIRVSGGHGGPGCISFRRETFEPRGGPDGGDGGEGGHVTFIASNQLGSLQDFRFKRIYQAPNGLHGSGANKAGRDGEDIEIRIPTGTIIKDTQTGETLSDLTKDKQVWVACKGGRGGKGNAHFVTSTHQAPKFAQPGEEGENREIKLELKLLADAAIIGFPNAGKSTLISRMSAARPKVADYPFTTLTPNLGVVSLPSLESFVIADIPGLIEGAHRGLGLGHKFLKHMERTHVFVHLLDGTQLLEEMTRPDESPQNRVNSQAIDKLIERYQTIRNELGLFNEKLLHMPEMVVLNKIDLFESDSEILMEARESLRQRIASIRGSHLLPQEPWIVSAVSGAGIEDLTFAIHRELKAYEKQTRFASKTPKSQTLLPDDEDMRT
jgi:GTP-binding protein